MQTNNNKHLSLSIPRSLMAVGLAAGGIGVLVLVVGRNTPVLWEWLCGISLLVWVFAHSIILGREEQTAG